MKNIWLINYMVIHQELQNGQDILIYLKIYRKNTNFTVFGSSYIHDTGNQLLKRR